MHRARIHLLAIGLYALLTIALTWPVAAQVTTHIPGEATWAFDESTFVWNMWWFKYSILALGQTPLETTYTFFPLGISLTTYTFNLFNAAFGLPLQLAFSLPLANNLTLFFSYVSSGYGTFLLVLYLLASSSPRQQPRVQYLDFRASSLTPYLAAFLAGCVYAFSASRMMYVALGHYNFVTIQWFPFYALYLLKSLRTGGLKQIGLAALFAAFCLYAELTFSVFLLFLSLFLILSELRHQPKQLAINNEQLTNSSPQSSNPPILQSSNQSSNPSTSLRARLPIFQSSLLIPLLTFLLTAPFLLAVLPDFLDPAYQEPGWGEGLKLSADLVGLVTFTPLHPLSGVDWVAELRAVIEGRSRFSDANTLFLGYGILALALLGFTVRRRTAAVWFWSAIFFTVLSLGPLLTINGQNRFDLDGLDVTYPLPFALLHYLPVLNAGRVPNRFGIPLTLALAVLAGFGLAWLLAKLGTRKVERRKGLKLKAFPVLFSVGLLLILLFDQYSVPLPRTDARIPEIYAQIGREPGDFTLLQLPLGWRNSYGTLGAERTQLQYYQAAHRRPILGGNTSRNPDFKFDYYAGIPLFRALTEVELYRTPDEVTLARAKQQAAELMTLYNVKYLTIHAPIVGRKPYEDTYLTTRKLALELIPHEPRPVYQSPEVEVYAVKPAAIPQPLQIDFGDWSSTPYRGEGWAGDEEIYGATANWITATQAEIFFPAQGQRDQLLKLQIAPFSYPDAPLQDVSLRLNGEAVGHFSLAEGWQILELLLPAGQLQTGLNRLELAFSHTAQPRYVLPGNWGIGQTGRVTPVDLEINSGADFAYITVGNGPAAQDASAHRQGINLAVIEPETGNLTARQGFDTAANVYEARALAQFIAGVPVGQIVVLASQGVEATAFFEEGTWAALRSLGVAVEGLAPPFSAIGVKGAPAETAALASGERSAYLRLGGSADTRNLAAAIDWVRFEEN